MQLANSGGDRGLRVETVAAEQDLGVIKDHQLRMSQTYDRSCGKEGWDRRQAWLFWAALAEVPYPLWDEVMGLSSLGLHQPFAYGPRTQ